MTPHVKVMIAWSGKADGASSSKPLVVLDKRVERALTSWQAALKILH